MPSPFTIAAAQSSSVAGDIPANLRHHEEFVRRARESDATAIVFPDLSLTGYEPSLAADTALAPSSQALNPLRKLSDTLDIMIVAGCPIHSGANKPYLGAFVFGPNQPVVIYRKRFLHTGEERHFMPSDDNVVVSHLGEQIAVAI